MGDEIVALNDEIVAVMDEDDFITHMQARPLKFTIYPHVVPEKVQEFLPEAKEEDDRVEVEEHDDDIAKVVRLLQRQRKPDANS